MYQSYFQLNSRPFTTTPFVDHYYPTPAIQHALDTAIQCVDRGSGPVVIVGEVGTGKSLLLSMLEQRFDDQFDVCHLASARLDQRQELLQSILFELGLPYKNMPEGELRLSLMDYLKPSQESSQGVLLLIDEAQNLSVELLDELRLIANTVRAGQPRVRLVMAGNSRLEDRLNDVRLESFNQRIATRCYLKRYTAAETADYVLAHIDRAGANGKNLFPKPTLKRIHELTEGCPRQINQVCDQALVRSFMQQQDHVDPDCVTQAWAEIQNLPSNALPPCDSPTTPEDDIVKSQNHPSDWSVVEFGELDEPQSDTSACESVSAADEFHQPMAVDSDRCCKATNDTGSCETQRPSEPACRRVEVPSEFPAPFSEEFEIEEEVVDRYLPLVAEQNRSSLEVTHQELDSIEDSQECIDADDAEAVSCETVSESSSTIQYEQPINSLDSDDFVDTSEDDQDLIVVSRVRQPSETDANDDGSIPFPATAASTGRAVRMDYNQLFEQLRSNEN